MSEQSLNSATCKSLELCYGSYKNMIDVVIVAAGIGSRMGADRPKQYLLLDDKTVLEHTVHNVLKSDKVNNVVLVLNKQDEFFKTTSLFKHPKIIITYGGAQRVDSVLSGIKAAQTEWVMVHDCARPFITTEAIDKLVCNVAIAFNEHNFAGGILACPVSDTLKRSDKNNGIECTVDRSVMFGAQTPQLFKREELIHAINETVAKHEITDEASALEFMGKKVLLVPNSSRNFKITTPDDLLLAQALLSFNSHIKQ